MPPFNTPSSGGMTRSGRRYARRYTQAVIPATPYSVIRNAGQQALINAAAGAVPYGQQLVQAARVAQRVYRYYRAQKTQKKAKQARRLRRSGFGGVSSAVYAGKFKKTKKRIGPQMSKIQSFMKTGYGITAEIQGKVNDPDVVYVGHSTTNIVEIISAVMGAIFRKLFKKCGVDVDNPNQELPLVAYNDSGASQWKIEFVVKTVTDNPVPFPYNIPADATLTSIIANFTTMRDIIGQIMSTDGNNNGQVIERVALYQQDTSVVNSWRLAGELNMKREVLQVYIQSTLTVQNRTKSETGDNDAEAVDNQPLKGLLYHFKGGVPKAKAMGYTPITRVNGNGVILARGAQLTAISYYGNTMREPPLPKYWQNCTKSAGVALDPGTIRKTSLSHMFNGYFNTCLFRMAIRDDQGVPGQTVGFVNGKCQLIALEERLNSGSTNLITVQYECDKKICARLITTKAPVIPLNYTDGVFNNLTP